MTIKTMTMSWWLRQRPSALVTVTTITSLPLDGDNDLGRDLDGRDRAAAVAALLLSSSLFDALFRFNTICDNPI